MEWPTDGKHTLETLSLCIALLGLIFIAAQLILLRRSINVNTYQLVVQQEREVWMTFLQNEEISKSFADSKSESRFQKKELLFSALLFSHFEAVFFHWKKGAVPKELWKSWEVYMLDALSASEFREHWMELKWLFWSKFVEHVSRRMPPPSA